MCVCVCVCVRAKCTVVSAVSGSVYIRCAFVLVVCEFVCDYIFVFLGGQWLGKLAG